ncbi:MAG: acetyl-CoA carboxylase carboxyltransferase subunit alpha [Alphaproteobacteria bacterium]|jgi:acetyl-CoA carboxylase carboxyl transferase subunit alpha|nr:acetyl-CoA carboxylase carboxyltransferase subunit alpha [Alphaproteobacteria bacterium]
MRTYLDFERPIAELEDKIQELRQLDGEGAGKVDIEEDVGRLQQKADRLLGETYAKLTPWQKTQVARHPGRPHFSDYAAALIEGFTPLAGDRAFADDKALVGGLGRFQGRSVMILGQEKGADTEGRVAHNFGMARPEGYRKAARLMRLADHFSLPVISFVDTPGAYPGISAEERGQAEAIARSTETCLEIGVPLIACIVGEGGSGGAVALASGNAVIMLEHAIYSVIMPEGCASILWRTAERAQDAADALKLTAQDLERLKVIDSIVPEPVGGAHRDRETAIGALGERIGETLQAFAGWESDRLRAHRRQKFLEIGRIGLA